MNQFQSPKDVAEMLQVEDNSVLDAIGRGDLRAYRFGDVYRIRRSDLDKYIASCIVGGIEGTSTHDQPRESNPGDRSVPTFAGRKHFRASGSVLDGASLWLGRKMLYPIKCSKAFFAELLNTFQGQTVRVGVSFGGPEPGSLGAWVQQKLHTQMNPTYAIAGLLIFEGYAERSAPGYIRFLTKDGRSLP